jgi:hypothetical protein
MILMRRIYVLLVALLLAAGVLQFYFAAVGAFTKPQTESSYALHGFTGGIVIPLLALLATLAAALSKAPGKLIGLTLAPLGLVVVQVLIIVLGNLIGGATEERSTPVALAILGLHAINGMAVLGVTGTVLRRARALAASTVQDTVQDTIEARAAAK